MLVYMYLPAPDVAATHIRHKVQSGQLITVESLPPEAYVVQPPTIGHTAVRRAREAAVLDLYMPRARSVWAAHANGPCYKDQAQMQPPTATYPDDGQANPTVLRGVTNPNQTS